MSQKELRVFERKSFFDTGRALITSGPASEPLLRADVKNWLKIGSNITADDTLIDDLIVAARNAAQEYTGLLFLPQTVQETRDEITDHDAFPLRWAPVTAVSSITYLDSAGNQQTLSTDIYGVDLYTGSGKPAESYVYRKSGKSWPDVWQQRRTVTITYTCGFASASAVPADLKNAMRMLISDMYQNRTDYVKRYPTAAEHLMNPYRITLL